jgi:Glycosyl hydrolases family 18
MPRPSRLLSCTAAALLATGLTGAGLFLTGLGPHTGLATSLTADAATSWPAHVFAPYVDTGLSNTTLTTVAADDGTKYFELAFADGGGCQWSLPNQSGWQSQVSALQAEGGDVSISFGGYTVDTDGTDLGNQCSSASAMATQVESVVTTMNVTHLDFDIESSEETNSADFTRTAQALALVRSWASSTGRALNISYTLPVLPSGFTSDGLNVLNAAQSSGFKPDVVNIMTMDYGTSGTEMGTASNQALDAAAGQVASVFGESTSAAYAMLGNTPMIGQNDSPGEIFSLADAATVESHAAAEGIALVSFWAEGRDNGGCPGQTSASSTCSGLSQSTGAFTQAFQAFTSGSGGGSTSPTPPPTTPPPTSPPPTTAPPTTGPPTSGSCAAAWSNSTAYTSGNEVSYGGHNWTASQWNYDEVPGGAAGAWTDDGTC